MVGIQSNCPNSIHAWVTGSARGGACSDPRHIASEIIGPTAVTEKRGRLTKMGTDKMFSSKGQDGSYRGIEEERRL